MKLLFVMDPFSRVHPQRDTTYLLICEAKKRGFQAYFAEHRDLFYQTKNLSVRTREILQLSSKKDEPDVLVHELGEQSVCSLDQFRVVFMRTDPPFDLQYLAATYLLDLVGEKILVLNRPQALREWNEKLSILQFPDLCPETLVASDLATIRPFVKKVGGKAVLKPLYRSGGDGIFFLQEKDANFSVIVETATAQGKEAVLVQRFMPEVSQGDKRLIVVDGEPLGAVLRVSQSEDHRSNIHVGAACFKADVTQRDREICACLKPKFLEQGLFLVGLDIIGNRLTEINVTSPTGFQEINRLNQLAGENTLEALTFSRLLGKLS